MLKSMAADDQSLPAEKSASCPAGMRFTFPILYENQTEMQP
jgi:hypothetical protein